jgi:hypothetical protein
MGDRRSPDQRRLDDAAFKRRRRQDRARITTRDKARTIYMSDVHEHEDPKPDEDMATSAEASEAAADEEAETVADEEAEHEEEEAQAADKD